jgi:hypothetical protein
VAKHRRMSGRSRRARTVIGGRAAGGALAAFVPAGMAAAATDVNKDKDDVQVNADTPGAAVGRPDLENPAPGVRVAQQFGDSLFNGDTTITKTLNGSALGTSYHQAFGEKGELDLNEATGNYEYTVGTGSNGSFTGLLNMTPGKQVGDAVPVRECNLVRSASTLAPQVSIRAQCNE